jgi:hypothetical protein
MNSDSSSFYITTYSEDERIEKALREERRLRSKKASDEDLVRKQTFESYFHSDLRIFTLPGLTFHAFRHLKIKFSFQPKAITNFVNQNVKFYVSLKYTGKYWRIRRDSLPANYKWKIYKMFYDKESFTIHDENIFSALMKIYEILVVWSRRHEKFRLNKFERYKKGDDVELDSDDEELFLNQEDRITLYQKRVKVLRRMLPPRN